MYLPVYVGVRSDHFCGAWLVGDSVKPRALGVIQMNQPATCLVVRCVGVCIFVHVKNGKVNSLNIMKRA